MPTSSFPIAVLQNGIKLTNEPPKGVRSNILRSLRIIPPDLYENACPHCSYIWKRILFGLSFFHSLVQERRKYGALGWNIVYEFNDSDFDVSYNHLKMYLNEQAEREAQKAGEDYLFQTSSIPWKALKYLTGTVNYGGRVTDNWDKRTLAAVLSRFYVEEIAEFKPFKLGPPVKFGAEDVDVELLNTTKQQVESDHIEGLESENYPESSGGSKTNISEGDEKSEEIDEIDIVSEEDKHNPYVLRNLKTHAGAIAFADKFPSTEEPEVFGMHENAELALQLNEAQRMVQSITLMQPKRSAGGGKKKKEIKKEGEKQEEGKDKEKKGDEESKEAEQEAEAEVEAEAEGEHKELGPDEEVLNIVRDIVSKLPPQLERSEAKEGILPKALTRLTLQSSAPFGKVEKKEDDEPSTPSSLSIVLSQEMVRFNNLLTVIKSSLSELEKAIGGVVVMSQTIEDIYNSVLFEIVPQQWADAAYPSLKPLGGWILDLCERLKFFRKWVVTGIPNVFWFSGFFFPQGFLTAILQTYSRKYKYPIDTLHFKYDLLIKKKEDIKSSPEDGVYVYGLFLEEGRWNGEKMELDEPNPGEMFNTMPILHFLPQQNYNPPPELYAAPLYKTAARYGVLSTTGLIIFLLKLILFIVRTFNKLCNSRNITYIYKSTTLGFEGYCIIVSVK
jgi:hypothetical protein